MRVKNSFQMPAGFFYACWTLSVASAASSTRLQHGGNYLGLYCYDLIAYSLAVTEDICSIASFVIIYGGLTAGLSVVEQDTTHSVQNHCVTQSSVQTFQLVSQIICEETDWICYYHTNKVFATLFLMDLVST